MALSFMPWLRSRMDTLVCCCATAIQLRRVRRAQALLPKGAIDKATFWRGLYLARNARLQRERERRRARTQPDPSGFPAQDISKADVLAAIARSRASREARLKERENG